MGSPPSEPLRRPDENQVDVTLTRGFWIGKFEVTQKQWTQIAGPLPRPMEHGRGDDFPMYWVNFADAERFARLATAKKELPKNWEFRLPTEAQWEYACRAGTTDATAFGPNLSPKEANILNKIATPAGTYPPNAWGIHDMHGNIFEWCRDWYHPQLRGGTDPEIYTEKGAPNRDGSYSRVRRGGAWNDPAHFCRSALRLRYEPDRSSDHIGFRVVAVQI